MNSVYIEALKADHPYVCAVPYYTKTASGQLSKEKIDRDYPSYVEYGELKGADVAIICYPYANGNNITEIAQEFWAKNIHAFTVYIPYFVVGENINESFILTEAVYFADAVICESEAQKSIYISVFEENPQFKVDKDKFLPFGNPKYDEMADIVTIPIEWVEQIGNRKACLVISGLMPILNDGIPRLERLVQTLKEYNNDEWVTIWRPHPFIEEGMKSMRSELLPMWIALKEWYFHNTTGILDDKSDYRKGMQISTKCVSDPSSLVHLYKLTGKEIEIL